MINKTLKKALPILLSYHLIFAPTTYSNDHKWTTIMGVSLISLGTQSMLLALGGHQLANHAETSLLPVISHKTSNFKAQFEQSKLALLGNYNIKYKPHLFRIWLDASAKMLEKIALNKESKHNCSEALSHIHRQFSAIRSESEGTVKHSFAGITTTEALKAYIHESVSSNPAQRFSTSLKIDRSIFQCHLEKIFAIDKYMDDITQLTNFENEVSNLLSRVKRNKTSIIKVKRNLDLIAEEVSQIEDLLRSNKHNNLDPDSIKLLKKIISYNINLTIQKIQKKSNDNIDLEYEEFNDQILMTHLNISKVEISQLHKNLDYLKKIQASLNKNISSETLDFIRVLYVPYRQKCISELSEYQKEMKKIEDFNDECSIDIKLQKIDQKITDTVNKITIGPSSSALNKSILKIYGLGYFDSLGEHLNQDHQSKMRICALKKLQEDLIKDRREIAGYNESIMDFYIQQMDESSISEVQMYMNHLLQNSFLAVKKSLIEEGIPKVLHSTKQTFTDASGHFDKAIASETFARDIAFSLEHSIKQAAYGLSFKDNILVGRIHPMIMSIVNSMDVETIAPLILQSMRDTCKKIDQTELVTQDMENKIILEANRLLDAQYNAIAEKIEKVVKFESLSLLVHIDGMEQQFLAPDENCDYSQLAHQKMKGLKKIAFVLGLAGLTMVSTGAGALLLS